MARASSAEAAFGSTVTFPGGAVVPDWSAVTTPSARAALTALFAAFIGSKWRGMDGVEEDTIHYGPRPPARMNYGRILGAESIMKAHDLQTGVNTNACKRLFSLG